MSRQKIISRQTTSESAKRFRNVPDACFKWTSARKCLMRTKVPNVCFSESIGETATCTTACFSSFALTTVHFTLSSFSGFTASRTSRRWRWVVRVVSELYAAVPKYKRTQIEGRQGDSFFCGRNVYPNLILQVGGTKQSHRVESFFVLFC